MYIRKLQSLGVGAATLCLLLLLPALLKMLPFPGGVFALSLPLWLNAVLLILITISIILLALSKLKSLHKYGLLAIGFSLGLLLSLTAEGSQGPMLGSGFSAYYFFICGLSAAIAAQLMGMVLKIKVSPKEKTRPEIDEPELTPQEVEERYESKLSAREKDFRWRLHNNGYRYNLHGKFQKGRLPGSPTLVLPRYHSVIFVRHCKKHGHVGCREFNINELDSYAREKVYQTKFKDDTYYRILRGKGWKVIEVWECKLIEETLTSTFNQVTRELDIALQRRGSAV